MLPSMMKASSMGIWTSPQPLHEFPAKVLSFGKLMRRPIARRGDTKFISPHMLGAIVLPYVQGVPGPQVAGLRQLLQESTRQPLDLSSTSVTALQELCQETIGRCWDAAVTPCCCAAIAVLWLALSPEKFPLQADTFGSAAGTAGKQKWALILPSSARVSELTYVTIVGTRYPELDTIQNDIIQFGNYLQGEQSTRGGFLPIFWDAPNSYIHASTGLDQEQVLGDKRWEQVNAFATTEWVAGSDGAVLSRSVTSCAGMTAYLVLLAQTKVGFLSGGRGRSFHQLTPQEQSAQKEEAFARATVALTRAQQICMIMGPLDMRGLVGAATIMGCLKYGACSSGLDAKDQPVLQLLLKDEDLLEAPDDSAFLQSLRISCSRVNGVYPPLALAEPPMVVTPNGPPSFPHGHNPMQFWMEDQMRTQVQLQQEVMVLAQNMKSLQEENLRLKVQLVEERETKYSTPPGERTIEKSLRSTGKTEEKRKKSLRLKEDG